MILRQFLHTDPVAVLYLFGCGGRAAGAVVDPLGDPSPYLKAAEATGMRIRYVVDTHLHADHVSAGRALSEAAAPPTSCSTKPPPISRSSVCATATCSDSAM
jgi:hydroxyacylglutathione hydrolase